MEMEKYNHDQGTDRSRRGTSGRVGKLFRILLPALMLGLSVTFLVAQTGGDEAAILRHYQMPNSALALSHLTEIDSVACYEGSPYSGIAYERYPNLRLSRVIHYRDGHKHGLFYVWYPDGTPQLSASYRRNRLNGRFVGWYPNGAVIYDIILNQGSFASDYIYDSDDSRQRTETETSEGEGNIGDGKED